MGKIRGLTRRLVTGVALAGSLSALAGCASVDRFGPRAVTYNEQLQQSRKTAIILNILRASDDQPLQFSEVTTVTGQGSVQGSASGELPVLGSAAGGARLYNLLPGIEASGGPSFTVSNLNTQEFFNGITAPIKPEIIASYANIGYSRYTLLPLLIASVEFDRGGTHYVFLNDPTRPQSYSVFIDLLDAMIQSGLTFETVETLDPVGPVLQDKDLRSAGLIGALLTNSAETTTRLKSFEIDDRAAYLTDTERAALVAERQRTYYRLTRSTLTSRYCFAADQVTLSEAEAGVGARPDAAITLRPVAVQGRQFAIQLSTAMKCGAGGAARANDRTDAQMVDNLRFSSRSVRSVFEYLGKIVRIERQAGSSARFDVSLPGRGGYRVFGVEQGPAGAGKVGYDGRHFALTRASDSDESERTVQLLSELLALYSSAKSFPAPSVVPILTR